MGLQKPALLIASEHLQYLQSCESLVKATGVGSVEQCETEKAILLDGWQRVYSTAQPGYAVTVKGARHTNFMDIPFLPVQAQSMFKPMLVSATIDSRRMWRITCDYLLAFFKKHSSDRTVAPVFQAGEEVRSLFGAGVERLDKLVFLR